MATRNFMHVGLALCYLAIGKPQKAAEHLDYALALAERDRNFTFLASFRKYLSVLFLLPSIAARHGEAIREIRKMMDIHYTKAERGRIFAMLEQAQEGISGLSGRELDVARLAARGMRNREIAGQLHISEETVKSPSQDHFSKAEHRSAQPSGGAFKITEKLDKSPERGMQKPGACPILAEIGYAPACYRQGGIDRKGGFLPWGHRWHPFRHSRNTGCASVSAPTGARPS
ncbi:MAG: helix-turn-helix transcriptional regulator [Oscillospiraceae bacterium]